MKHKWKQFLQAVLFGVLVSLGLHALESTEWGEGLMNSTFDILVYQEAASTLQSTSSEEIRKYIYPDLAFIDIDPETYTAWGEPLNTPAAQLARMIGYAVQGGVRIVVLDFLLEHPGPDPAAEQQLRETLQSIALNHPNVHIIFPARINFFGQIKPGLYEDLISNYPNFHRGTPLLIKSASDGVVRFWGTYTMGKERDGKTRLLWNNALLCSVLKSENLFKLLSVEKTIFSFIKNGNLAGESPWREVLSVKQGSAPFQTVKLKIHVGQSDPYYQRIRYLLRPPRVFEKDDKGNLYQNRILAGKQLGLLDGYPPPSENDLQQWFQNKIVVIGNSSPDAGDIHKTPIGNMAGMYVIGNVINTQMAGLQPRHLSSNIKFLRGFLEIGLIILTAAAFYFFRSYFGRYALAFLILALFIPLSSYFFREHGMLIDFIIPSLALLVQHKIFRFLNIFQRGNINSDN